MSSGSPAGTYRVIGLMSGTSLDGVDLALCELTGGGEDWKYKIIRAETAPYPMIWKNKLETAQSFSGLELTMFDRDLGSYYGELVNDFAGDDQVDFVSSHGHTIFHRPEFNLTSQVGHAATLAAACGLPVVADFRSMDVAMGGQGAPLVPMGDRLLFGDYDYCLNMGGFANVSFTRDDRVHAFDVSPVNTVMNYLANQKGRDYDAGGEMARQGRLYDKMLERLNKLPFYSIEGPKSLGKSWLEGRFLPIIDRSTSSIETKLRTFSEHVAVQMGRVLNEPGKRCLVTGGGALNTHLMERIAEHVKVELIVPERELVDFKEALIFALLGTLRWRNEINIYGSVTGGKSHVGGSIYMG